MMQNANHTNFTKWFPEILKSLYQESDAGFVVLMASLPLLERYLREKSGVYENNLSEGSPFYQHLSEVFPALRDGRKAQDFWKVFRHGLLHQAAMSSRTNKGIEMPRGVLSHDFGEAVSIDGENFLVNPVKFSKHVISTIQSDFPTYEAHNSPNHALPAIIELRRNHVGTSTPG